MATKLRQFRLMHLVSFGLLFISVNLSACDITEYDIVRFKGASSRQGAFFTAENMEAENVSFAGKHFFDVKLNSRDPNIRISEIEVSVLAGEEKKEYMISEALEYLSDGKSMRELQLTSGNIFLPLNETRRFNLYLRPIKSDGHGKNIGDLKLKLAIAFDYNKTRQVESIEMTYELKNKSYVWVFRDG